VKQRKQAQLALVGAYKRVFESPDGQDVLKDLMFRFNQFGTSFVPGNRDVVIFNEGGRNVVLHIMDTIKLTPDELDKLYTEVRTTALSWSLPDASKESESS
jgi:hypothetical protein